jgi:hypothetical protein
MSSTLIDIAKSSREFDDIFQLTTQSQKKNNSYLPYIWKAPKPLFFKGCDYVKVFPMAVNLYLRTCNEEELIDLLTKRHFLRISMYYDDDECIVTCISVMNLTIADLEDHKYQQLLLSCARVPCEIRVGPLWHFIGINRMMCQNRRVEAGYIVVNPTISPFPFYEFGIQLYGRNAYPTETTETMIQEREQLENIFILRK